MLLAAVLSHLLHPRERALVRALNWVLLLEGPPAVRDVEDIALRGDFDALVVENCLLGYCAADERETGEEQHEQRAGGEHTMFFTWTKRIEDRAMKTAAVSFQAAQGLSVGASRHFIRHIAMPRSV